MHKRVAQKSYKPGMIFTSLYMFRMKAFFEKCGRAY